MDVDVEAAVKSCTTCSQHDKTAITRAAPLQPVPFPSTAWEKVAIDIVGPFNSGSADCRYAITLIDYYSKWPEVAFISNVTTATVISFLSAVFSREGNPLELVTDNGSCFVSAEFEDFLAARDITHCRSSNYYPQSNCEIERWNRVFVNCLQTADIQGQPWLPYVTDFLLAYRATPHAITSVSPAELLHGRPFRTKLNIKNLAPPRASSQMKCGTLSNIVARRQAKIKQYTDKRRAAQTANFPCGSYVRIRKPGFVKKGRSKFIQPLQVLAQKGPSTCKLSDGKVWNDIHLSSASPAIAAETHDSSVQPDEVYLPSFAPLPSLPA
uniref:Integrase catalytic domain-containing protein n=1 Tax=Oryzias latipes TaxID=8090 RepID=A0A3P9JV72_ORYLA